MANIGCDKCQHPARYLVGDMASGEQSAFCAEHLVAPTAPSAPSPPPAVCEMCEAQPPVAVQTALLDGSSMALCSSCLLLSGHMAYLNAPAELRASVDDLASSLSGAGGGGGGRRRRGGADRSPLRIHEPEPVEPDQTGLEHGVALDSAGQEPAPETAAGGEPQ